MSLLNVTVDSPAAAADNTTAIAAATGNSTLPQGTVYVNPAPTITGEEIRLSGADTTVESALTTGDYISRAALLVRPAAGPSGTAATAVLSWRGDETAGARGSTQPAGQVGWNFVGDDVTPRRPIRIKAGGLIPPENQYMRAYHGTPFTGRGRVLKVPAGHGLAVGDWVFATDGPRINECVGEFAKIEVSAATSVTLDKPLIRTYAQGTLVSGAFPSSITLRDISLTGQHGSLIFQQAADVTLSNVIVNPTGTGDAAEWTDFIGCGRVLAEHCTFPGLGMSSGADLKFNYITTPSLKAEQCVRKVEVSHSRIGWLDTQTECTHWTLYGNYFYDRLGSDLSLGIYDYWQVRNCYAEYIVRVRGKNAKVVGLTSNQGVIVQPSYAGAPAGAGTGVSLSYVDAPYIWLMPGSTGKLFHCTGDVVGDTSGWRIT